jgi:hypothetical protein
LFVKRADIKIIYQKSNNKYQFRSVLLLHGGTMSHIKCLHVDEVQLEMVHLMEAMADQVDAFGEPFGPRLRGTPTCNAKFL